MAFSLEQERLHEHGGFYDKICGFNREWFPGGELFRIEIHTGRMWETGFSCNRSSVACTRRSE
jgi:hypothetical protein